jgi:sodium-dependent dicarboxylate transporter 2/3/5
MRQQSTLCYRPAPPPESEEDEKMRKIRTGILMSVAYASNIGGTGSLIGSTPQLAFQGILDE